MTRQGLGIADGLLKPIPGRMALVLGLDSSEHGTVGPLPEDIVHELWLVPGCLLAKQANASFL